MSQEPEKKRKSTQTTLKKKQAIVDNLPEVVNVLGKEFKVVVTNLKGLHGDCDGAAGVIRIHQSMSIEEAQSTLFHEAIHAAFYQSGHTAQLGEDKEEAIVRCLENAFASIVDIKKLNNKNNLTK